MGGQAPTDNSYGSKFGVNYGGTMADGGLSGPPGAGFDPNNMRNPFGGGDVLGNVGHDYQEGTDNPIGHVWNDSPYGAAAGALSTSAQGGNGWSGTPFEGYAGAPPDQKMKGNQSNPGSGIPSLNNIANQPSPFQNWLNPNNVGGLSNDATFNPNTLDSTFLGKSALDGGGKVDTNALNALQGYAVNKDGTMNTADSPWLTLQKQNIDTMTGQARDQAGLDAQASGDQAMSNAAMHGGITGGGAARIGAVSDMSGATGMQKATTAGNLAKNDAGMQDWTNKIGVAGALPGMQQALAGFNTGQQEFNANTTNAGKEFNIGNLIGGMQSGNQNLLQQYAQTIAGQGGSEMADAMRHSGKKKG